MADAMCFGVGDGVLSMLPMVMLLYPIRQYQATPEYRGAATGAAAGKHLRP
jgi:hypothetical protein